MRYIVSCRHVAEAYRLNALALDVNAYVQGNGIMLAHREAAHGNPVEWYASIPHFGCGKSCCTAEHAIRSLLRDNGCTDITIAKVETVTVDGKAYTAAEAAAEYLARQEAGHGSVSFAHEVEAASPSEEFFDAYLNAIQAAYAAMPPIDPATVAIVNDKAYSAAEAAAEYRRLASVDGDVIAFSSEVELAAPSEAFFDAYAQAIDAESSIFGAMAALEEQGREDHGKYGRTRKTCPYKIGTEERAAWLRGFDAAAALAKANGEQV